MTEGANSAWSAIAPWTDQALLLAASSARFAFAFILVPLFSPQVMPATVRNSVIIAFGFLTLGFAAPFQPGALSAGNWLQLLAREAAAGVTIGFFFATIVWAMGAAGEIIDQKVGSTLGQLLDPLGQQQESLTSTLLARFAQTVFVSAGGLTLLVATVLQSFVALPLKPGPVPLDLAAVGLFEGEVGRLFAIAFLIAAPVLVILYLIDAALGLLNRFAQQFNVFALSMSLKSYAAVVVLAILLPALATAVVADLDARRATIEQLFRITFGGAG